jgi:hypothetical protein
MMGKISLTSVINWIRIKTQVGTPATPASGYSVIYEEGGALKLKDDAGTITVFGASTVDDTAYDATDWDGVTTIAPSKNAVRDKFESLVAGGRTLIEELTPTGTGTASFAAIAGTYKKLTIEFSIRGTQAAETVSGDMLFNTDATDGNYRTHLFQWYDANSTGVVSSNNNALLSTVLAGTAPANEFTQGKYEIIQYANTAFYKHVTGQVTFTRASTTFNQTQIFSMRWANTAAITQIDIILSAGNYDTGSVLRLYGES